MNCDDFIPFVDTYVDGEFDDREQGEMEAHLSQCSDCHEQVAFQVRMKQQFRDCLGQARAPESLRERICAQLEEQMSARIEAQEAAGLAAHQAAGQVALAVDGARRAAEAAEAVDASEPVDLQAQRQTRRARLLRHAWVGAPLAAAIMAVIALPIFTVAPAASDQLPVVEQTVEWHRGNYPIEVTGPDVAGVSDWFRNKVDFPVRLPRFAGERQVNLLGGRIANIQDRRAAYLLYEVDGTRLSVMVFDGGGITVPADKIRSIAGRDVMMLNNKGYEVAVLQDSGVTYALTSELPREKFIELLSHSIHR